MKHVNITYHMHNTEDSVAETCITLPMTDEAAADIMEKGADSQHLNPMLMGEVYRVLRSLATLQGYTYDGFCCAELMD